MEQICVPLLQHKDHILMYMDSCYKNKAVSWLCYLYHRNPYASKMAYLYWCGLLHSDFCLSGQSHRSPVSQEQSNHFPIPDFNPGLPPGQLEAEIKLPRVSDVRGLAAWAPVIYQKLANQTAIFIIWNCRRFCWHYVMEFLSTSKFCDVKPPLSVDSTPKMSAARSLDSVITVSLKL